MRKMALFAGAATALLCWGGAASAKGMTIAQLKAMATDLGYDVTVEGNRVTIPDQGKEKWNAYLGLSEDGSNVKIYIPMSNIPPEKRAAVPYRDILLSNNVVRYYFALNTNDGGDEWIDVEADYDTASLNKQSLRKAIDGLVARLGETEGLWNQDNWKVAAAAPATAAPTASACLTDKGPLGAKNVSLVSRKAAEVGDIQQRPTAAFKPGEPFLVYLEPTGFSCKPGPNGHTLADIDGSLKLVQGDKVLFEKTDYLKGVLDSDGPIRSVFFNLSASIDGVPPGAYALKFALRDVYGDRNADVVVPLTVAP